MDTENIIRILSFFIILVPGELLALGLFRWLNVKFNLSRSSGSKAQWKGHIERFMLFLGLANGLQAVLAVFGGLKIGTRLKADNEKPVESDYFLIGNMASVIIAIFYSLLLPHLTDWLNSHL